MAEQDTTDSGPTTPQVWQRRFNMARNAQSAWREEARDAFDFYSGQQWTMEEQNILDEQGKPALSFNRAATIIDLIAGSEVNNRQEIRYLPRSLEDTGEADVMTAAAKYFREQSDTEDEESTAFHDMLIGGMGWTEKFLDYETDLDGMIRDEKRDPLAMYWDPSAEKDNLEDRRWQIYVKSVTRQEFIDNWGEDKLSEVAGATEAFNSFDSEVTAQSRRDYEIGGLGFDPETGNINIAQCQWYELETVYRVVNPETGQIEKLSPEKMGKIRKFLDELNLPYVKMRQRHYYQCFIAGDVELDNGDCPTQQGFSFSCMTAKRDRNARCWYGMVRLMRDPQRWGNKWLSQVLHILNTNTKGGVIIETTAVDDQEDVEDRWSASDSVIWVNEGGTGKITPKPQTAMPQGFEKLSEFAMNSLPFVTGVSPDMMGLAQRDQPAVLEAQRKQSGMTVLAPLFNSLRRYRKVQGRLMLEMIQKYVSDGRMIRIVGNEGARYVPLTKKPGTMTYDCIVDDAPTSMNVKDKVWMIMSQAAPFLAKMGLPIPPEVLDYVDLPATLVDKWKQAIQRQSQMPPKGANPADVAKAQQLQQQTQLDAQQHQADMQDQQQERQHEAQIQQMKLRQQAIQTQGIAATAQAQFARAQAEQVRSRIIPIEAARAARHEEQQHQAELEHKRAKTEKTKQPAGGK